MRHDYVWTFAHAYRTALMEVLMPKSIEYITKRGVQNEMYYGARALAGDVLTFEAVVERRLVLKDSTSCIDSTGGRSCRGCFLVRETSTSVESRRSDDKIACFVSPDVDDAAMVSLVQSLAIGNIVRVSGKMIEAAEYGWLQLTSLEKLNKADFPEERALAHNHLYLNSRH